MHDQYVTFDIASGVSYVFSSLDHRGGQGRQFTSFQPVACFNVPGMPEILPIVFEELLVNALAHRDYLVNAPIRLFIFDNRIEIIRPGHLPSNLTVAKIRTGNSIIRNPLLVSYIAQGLLPYRGLGSGIKRALEDWPEIDFTDDREGCLFTAAVHRKEPEVLEEVGIGSGKSSVKSSGKTDARILELLRQSPEMTIPELATELKLTTRVVGKRIAKLRDDDRLRRIGPAKGDRWEVVECPESCRQLPCGEVKRVSE